MITKIKIQSITSGIMILYFMSFLISVHPFIFQNSYYLLPNSQIIFITISQNDLNLPSAAMNQQLKITTNIQYLDSSNGYVQKPFKTANIIVKYWKNDINTPADTIKNYSYSMISYTKQFYSAVDPIDNGLIDIQAVYNYENNHNFLYLPLSNQPGGSSPLDPLFTIAIYRNSDTDLTSLFGMSDITEPIKIIITINPAPSNDLACSFCFTKIYCANRPCQCYMQSYTDCRTKKKYVKAAVQSTKTVNQQNLLNKGEINFYQIQPQVLYTGSQQVKVKVKLNFNDNNYTRNNPIDQNNIIILYKIQNKSEQYFKIPNIYNYNIIDSKSGIIKVNSVSNKEQQKAPSKTNVRSLAQVDANYDYISFAQSLTINKDQFLSVSVSYLDDNNNSTANQILQQVDITMTNPLINNQSTTTSFMSIGLLMGIIAIGFFFLIMLICVLHCVVVRKCKIRGIFNLSSSSNRLSMVVQNYRDRLGSNMSLMDNTKINLPSISYDFFQEFIFKPTNYLQIQKLKHKRQLQIQNNQLSKKKRTKFISIQNQIQQSNQICSICLQQFTPNSKVKYTHCGHLLDSKCLDSWMKKDLSCPICRQSFEKNEILFYQKKIKFQILYKQPYQTILQQQMQNIKQLHSEWKRITESNKQQESGFRHTEQSLVSNNKQLGQSNQINQNISTMLELQNSNKKISFNTLNQKEKNNQLNNGQISIDLDNKNKSVNNLNNPNIDRIFQVFVNNSEMKIKKIQNIFQFYRCFYMYHLKNKKFQKQKEYFFAEQESFKTNSKHSSLSKYLDAKFENTSIKLDSQNIDKRQQINGQMNQEQLSMRVQLNKSTQNQLQVHSHNQYQLNDNSQQSDPNQQFQIKSVSKTLQMNKNLKKLRQFSNSNGQTLNMNQNLTEFQKSRLNKTQSGKKAVSMMQQMQIIQRDLPIYEMKQENIQTNSYLNQDLFYMQDGINFQNAYDIDNIKPTQRMNLEIKQNRKSTNIQNLDNKTKKQKQFNTLSQRDVKLRNKLQPSTQIMKIKPKRKRRNPFQLQI